MAAVKAKLRCAPQCDVTAPLPRSPPTLVFLLIRAPCTSSASGIVGSTANYNRYASSRGGGYDIDGNDVHYPTRPVDKDKAESELSVNIKKATNPDETAPKQKHVRSASPEFLQRGAC